MTIKLFEKMTCASVLVEVAVILLYTLEASTRIYAHQSADIEIRTIVVVFVGMYFNLLLLLALTIYNRSSQ